MLLRFRIGSGPTEPPSVPLPRAALHPLHPPPHPLQPPSPLSCNGDSHHPAHAGLARWRRVVVMCTRTTRVHVHAGTHVQPDRCLNPHTPPPLKYRPFVFSLPPAFPTLRPLITRAGRYTLFFLPARRGGFSSGTERSSFPLSDAPDLETRSLDCIARLRMIRLDPSTQAVFRQDAAERHVRFHLMRAIFFSDLTFKYAHVLISLALRYKNF